MKILDCRKIKLEYVDNIKKEIDKLDRKLTLTIIQIGNNEASNIYINQKCKLASYLNINIDIKKLDYNVEEKEILNIINELNNNDLVDGIIIQLPIPDNLNLSRLQNEILPEKDVDGMTYVNKAKLISNEESLIPCTAKAIIDIFNYNNIDIMNKNIVIIGRSELVGKPLFNLLINNNATVTLCHSKTNNLIQYTKQADILIIAIGKPKYITKEYIKKDAIVIDVGINRIDNKLCGDVDLDDVIDKVSFITPVPNGVGQLTTYEVFYNTLKAYKIRKEK